MAKAWPRKPMRVWRKKTGPWEFELDEEGQHREERRNEEQRGDRDREIERTLERRVNGRSPALAQWRDIGRIDRDFKDAHAGAS